FHSFSFRQHSRGEMVVRHALGPWALLTFFCLLASWPRNWCFSQGFACPTRRRCGATALEPLRAEPFDLEAMLAKYEQQEETADEQTDEKAAEAKRPLSSFQVGETVKGRVNFMNVRGPSVAYVDIGAEKDAALEFGEMEDGFPAKLTPVRKGQKVEARVLEYDLKAERIYLTRRSGDLARPRRLTLEEENHNPEPLRRVAQSEWLDAEVLSLVTFGAFVNVYPSWGDKTPVVGLLHKKEFAADFAQDPEKAIRGGRIKVRKLSLNSRGELKVTMKQP
ncbi:unnamed protein product, partial [Durusdinium trenchii]